MNYFDNLIFQKIFCYSIFICEFFRTSMYVYIYSYCMFLSVFLKKSNFYFKKLKKEILIKEKKNQSELENIKVSNRYKYYNNKK